jgi:hypothetical protein
MEREEIQNLITLFQRIPTPSRREVFEKLTLEHKTDKQPLSPFSSLPQNTEAITEASKTASASDKKPSGKRYSNEEKKRAVILAVQLNNNRLAAIRLQQIPAFFTLHESTIRGWKKELANDNDIRREKELRKNKNPFGR